MKNTYYQDELRYLRDVAPEFARVHPEIARRLTDVGSDPDVERLLEGFAFLTARVRQKLDDELPELTASLMALLWPHYLRPTPSMTVMELTADPDALRAPLDLPAGAEFASAPIDGTRCIYRSSWPVMLRPWVIETLALETPPAEPARLRLVFRALQGKLADLELGRVRLHLFGDPRTSFALYLLLAGHTASAVVGDPQGGARREEITLPPGAVQAAGLVRDETALPYPAYTFPGYAFIQEYFALKERFLFVDLVGLDRAVAKLELEDRVEVVLTFDRRLESYPLVARENVRLHCAPAVNLFRHAAEPIRLAHDRVRYLVQPARSGIADRRHAEIFSVDSVVGFSRQSGGESREFEPFYAFSHADAGDAGSAAFYHTEIAPSLIGKDARWGTDTFVSFVSGAGGAMPDEETVSIELTCTNRDLVRELRAGDVREPTDRSPAYVRFANLMKPTPTASPPLGQQLHWRLISHLSLNYVTLTNVTHFRELLRVYDFEAAHDAQRARAHQQRLDGIKQISAEQRHRLVRGAAVRGFAVAIELDEDHFAGEGDAYLFATIIERFLAAYATINSFSQLTCRMTRSGQEYVFPPRWGEQPTPAELQA